MTNQAKQVSLDDVLSDMALTSARPDAKVVADYVRRYPQFAEELVDFAAELAAEAISAAVDEDLESSTTGTSPAVSKALSHLQNRLYEVRQEEAARKASGRDLFGALDREQFRSVATKVGVNTFFLTKLTCEAKLQLLKGAHRLELERRDAEWAERTKLAREFLQAETCTKGEHDSERYRVYRNCCRARAALAALGGDT